MKLDASVVIPGLFAATYAAWGLLSAAAVMTRKLNERLERRYWKTLHTRSCWTDACKGRQWERITRDFNPDLGSSYDIPETCPACKLDAHQVIEIDFGSSRFRDDVRALDREHTINSGAL